MKRKIFVSMGLAVLTAAVLSAAPVWADADDPWAPDMDGDQIIPQSTVKVVPVPPAEEDTGDPWFNDTKENEQTLMMPVTTFGTTPAQPVEEDTGDPWFNDTKEHEQTNLQSAQ